MLTFPLSSNERIPRSRWYVSIGSENDPRSYGKNGATTAMVGDTPRVHTLLTIQAYSLCDTMMAPVALRCFSPNCSVCRVSKQRSTCHGQSQDLSKTKIQLAGQFLWQVAVVRARPGHEADQGHVIKTDSIGTHPSIFRSHLRIAQLCRCPCIE